MTARLDDAVHLAQPWAIHELAHDFDLLDVWALPVRGSARDFDLFIEMFASFDPRKTGSVPARALWAAREVLGNLLDLERAPDDGPRTIRDRLPERLRGSAAEIDMELPFVPVYRTDDEFAAEISNRTVHGILHAGWVAGGDGLYSAQMAVYVKPQGLLGRSYLALISPFRHLVVYPALMRQLEEEWNERCPPETR